MMALTTRCLLLSIAINVIHGLQAPIVKISNGIVQGTYETSGKGEIYSEFVGIPYAEPPIGELRFESPVPVRPWKGTWMANHSTVCSQISHWQEPEGGETLGEEDCLHVNVFVPGRNINADSNLDVIIHIHGGAFMFGHGLAYSGPKYLMDRNVILVTFNYRVGVLGFLSTLDENLPGNFGMKDQTLALKWVKENIEYFGGNPNGITITGLSAGGASVHYHYLSPLSRGLFNRGISVSGCALNAWTLEENPVEKTRIISEAVGCETGDNKKLVECLKSRNGKQLVEATRLLRSWLFNPFSPLGLVVEKGIENAFLPKHPYEILKDGEAFDVPWIVSATTAEGLYPVAEIPLKSKNFEDLNQKWDEIAPLILHYADSVTKDEMKSVSQTIKQYYLGNKNFDSDTFDKLIQLSSDRLFVADLELAARKQSQVTKSNVYFYQYDYTAEKVDTLAVFFTGNPTKYGVCHGDDMLLVFSDPYKEHKIREFSGRDEKIQEFLHSIWINFSKKGGPFKDWKSVSKKRNDPIDYLYIGSPEKIEMRQAKEFGHRSFWESLPLSENARLFGRNEKEEL